MVAAATIGVAMLYSAADGSWDPWAARQIIRFSVGLVILVTIALVDLRFWWRYSYFIFWHSSSPPFSCRGSGFYRYGRPAVD